jgi:hypothetical protein
MKKGKKFVRRAGKSFQTTESEAFSEPSIHRAHSPEPFALNQPLGDISDSYDVGSESNRDQLMDLPGTTSPERPVKELSFTFKNLQASDSNSNGRSNNTNDHGKDSLRIRRLSRKLKKLFIPWSCVKSQHDTQTSRPYGEYEDPRDYSRKTSSGRHWGDNSYSRRSEDYSESENIDNFELSFSILPRQSVRNLENTGLSFRGLEQNKLSIDAGVSIRNFEGNDLSFHNHQNRSGFSIRNLRGSNTSVSFRRLQGSSTESFRKSGSSDGSFRKSLGSSGGISICNLDSGRLSIRNLDADGELDMEQPETQVALLAESRTPSFNTMLHANDFYSDSCMLIKRKTVRISWEDLESNTNSEEIQLSTSTDYIRDIGGRRVSDMMFEKPEEEEEGTSQVFGVRRMKPRGSLLVRQPKEDRNSRGGMPLWKGTSTLNFNRNFGSFVLSEKTKDWLKNFKACDPRHQILTFFNDVANEGATGSSEHFERDHVSPLLKYLYRSSVFTVWRPTSLQAIRRMMLGEGVGKGLDIKGKSAKRGKLSAFVPFLQIYKEEDKAKVRTLSKNCKIRVFFTSRRDRDIVVTNLTELAKELEETVRAAKQILADPDKHDEETLESAMRKMTLDMKDSTIEKIDGYALTEKFGINIQERLFWEGMVVRQDIYRKAGSPDDIGRTSMPSFQDMNFASLREPRNSVPGGCTRAVILQYNPPDEENHNPMSPLNLVMAYEENNRIAGRRRVIPVVSDFDCFIVGTRGVRYREEVPEDQIKIVKWMVEQTENVLDNGSTESWTKRWLDVLKESGNKGFHPKIPAGGYSDPKTKFIFKHAIDRLSKTGAVRHGAECYNYYFPQELDEELLVISDELPDNYAGKNWVYVNQNDLKTILKFKIDKGYTFPLNPKWILCDEGWKEVYDKLFASEDLNVKQSLGCFYPPESGLRDLIEKIHKKHPLGFQRMESLCDFDNTRSSRGKSLRLSQVDGTIAMDLAEQELKYYFILQRAKHRLRGYLRMNSILDSLRNGTKNAEEKGPEKVDDDDRNNNEEVDPKAGETEIGEGDDKEEEPRCTEIEIKEEPGVIETIAEEGDETEEEPRVVETTIDEGDKKEEEHGIPETEIENGDDPVVDEIEELENVETEIELGNSLDDEKDEPGSMSRIERFEAW